MDEKSIDFDRESLMIFLLTSCCNVCAHLQKLLLRIHFSSIVANAPFILLGFMSFISWFCVEGRRGGGEGMLTRDGDGEHVRGEDVD